MQDETAYIGIAETAQFLGISIDTLRRWDRQGKLKSTRFVERGHRYYSVATVTRLKYGTKSKRRFKIK